MKWVFWSEEYGDILLEIFLGWTGEYKSYIIFYYLVILILPLTDFPCTKDELITTIYIIIIYRILKKLIF